MSEYHERQWRKREAEKRRREAKKKRQALELQRMQEFCKTEHIAVQRFLHAQEASELRDFFVEETISNLHSELEVVGQKMHNANYQQLNKKIKQQLKFLRKLINDEVNAAGKRKNQELKRLAQLEKELSATIKVQTGKIADTEHSEYGIFVINEIFLLHEELNKLQHLLSNRQFDKVLNCLPHFSANIVQVEDLALRRYEIKQKTVELLTKIKEQALDTINKIWVGRELSALEQKTNMLLIQYSQGIFPEISAAGEGSDLAAIEEQHDLLLLEARECQQDEEERKSAVDIFIAALEVEGFTVSPPKLEGGQRGVVLINAVRPGRSRKQEVAMKINLDGNVKIDVDGGDPGDVRKIQEARLDKKKGGQVSCRQVATKILEFVAKEGMELEEVKRKWHNPDRIEKGAKKMPSGIGTENHR